MQWRAAELLSQVLDEPLTPADQFRLRMHLKMCGNCREVERQLDAVRVQVPQLGLTDEDLSESPAPQPKRGC